VESVLSVTPQIVCLGEIILDLFPSELGRKMAEVPAFQPKPGGAPANVAVAARKLGVPSAFIGKVGDDAFGYHLIGVLKREDVDTRGMRVDPQARTTLAFIAMPDENTAEFVFYRNPGADLMLQPDEIDHSLLQNARAFHFGSLSLVEEPAYSATLHALTLAHQAGAMVSFDVNYRPTLWKNASDALERIWSIIASVDLLKINENELRLLSGEQDIATVEAIEQAGRSLLAKGPRLIGVTLGPNGSFFITPEACGFVPAFKVKTVDATGCGDAFIAGLLSRLVQGQSWQTQLEYRPLQAAFRYANAVGALTALKPGVIPALPNAAQVDEFLSQTLSEAEKPW